MRVFTNSRKESVTRVLAFLLTLDLAANAFSADDLPKTPSLSRYNAMMDRSPFAVATAVVAPAATPNFAKDLYVANAARAKDGDLVTIASSTDKNFKKYLTTSAPVEGYSISNIEWSEKVGATKVTIAKDGQFATLTFNQALLTQPLANSQPAMPQPVMPPSINQPPPQIVPSQPPFYPRPMPVPSLPVAPLNQAPTPPPRIRSTISRNPAATPVQNATPEPQL